MFGIFFKDKDTSFDNGYGMHILASISLGEYVEELHIPIDYWGIEEYKNSWAKSIADGIEKKKHSVLITSMHEPESLNFISAWIIYYDGEISYVQTKINEYVNKREIFNEDGFKISEWIVKTKDVIDFYHSIIGLI